MKPAADMHALWNPDRILLNLVLGLLQLSQSPGSCQQVQKGRGIKRQTHMVLVLGSLPQAAKVGQLALHRNLQVAGPCLEQLCAPQTALLISKPKAHVMWPWPSPRNGSRSVLCLVGLRPRVTVQHIERNRPKGRAEESGQRGRPKRKSIPKLEKRSVEPRKP